MLLLIGFAIGYIVNGMTVKKQETIVIENDSICKRVMQQYYTDQKNPKKKAEFIKLYMQNSQN